jgi:signal transduction histidine kinase
VAVLREALSNAARHADAARVDVLVRVDAGWVVVHVRDDGRGLRSSRRSGLANLSDRAVALGGSLVVAPGQGQGTTLVWRAPLHG